MSRLIDADALLSELEALNKETDKRAAYTGDRNLSVTWDDAIQAIKRAHTVESEIIRCRECKHYDGRPCGIVDWYNTADDFCSRAERRRE